MSHLCMMIMIWMIMMIWMRMIMIIMDEDDQIMIIMDANSL